MEIRNSLRQFLIDRFPSASPLTQDKDNRYRIEKGHF
ncbi:MAG: hypothetical protein ACI808_002449, partial [Paraglaciecola sp.]